MHPLLTEIKNNLDNQSILSKCFLAVAHTPEIHPSEVKDIVKDDPIAATLFCLMVIKETCPELEGIIATHANASLTYVKSIKRTRFERAEPLLQGNIELFKIYIESVTNGERLHDLEEYIHADTGVHLTYLSKLNYDHEYFKHSEEVLKNDPEAAYLYALFIKNDRFVDAEEIIAKSKPIWDKYAQVFGL